MDSPKGNCYLKTVKFGEPMKTPKNPFNSRMPLSGLIFSMVLLAAPKGLTPVIASAETVPLQPFALQVRQIETALDYQENRCLFRSNSGSTRRSRTRTRRPPSGRSNKFSTSTPWRSSRSTLKAV